MSPNFNHFLCTIQAHLKKHKKRFNYHLPIKGLISASMEFEDRYQVRKTLLKIRGQMQNLTRTLTIPLFKLTRLADETSLNSTKVVLHSSDGKFLHQYHTRQQMEEFYSQRQGFEECLRPIQYPLFPVVLDQDGVPWAEANLWLLSLAKDQAEPEVKTLKNKAYDLTDYLKFLEINGMHWTDFPEQRLKRCTYKYNGFLKIQVNSNLLSRSVAKRRMSTVVSFYRDMIHEFNFKTHSAPWRDKDILVDVANSYGRTTSKIVKTTDVAIQIVPKSSLYEEVVLDERRLRPLPLHEQAWLKEALIASRNQEMKLLHEFALSTGGRIQTLLTFRVANVSRQFGEIHPNMIRINVGPGTGVDTKNNKPHTLHLPYSCYEKLRVYSTCEVAMRRRKRAEGGDRSDQYLFLTNKGAPYYASKQAKFSTKENTKRYKQTGQAIWEFINSAIIPYIQAKYDPNFHYTFHDLRATFGMNLVDVGLKLLADKKLPMNELFSYVQLRLGHASIETTERYLNFRRRLALAKDIQIDWERMLDHSENTIFEGNVDEL